MSLVIWRPNVFRPSVIARNDAAPQSTKIQILTFVVFGQIPDLDLALVLVVVAAELDAGGQLGAGLESGPGWLAQVATGCHSSF